ncbi:MAG TPA: DUF1731 domain-containing protein [Phycisphaerales bacterium]|nr:DUF1731 domain-containing protein [Phycisphaerales bacterium]
MNSSVDTGTVHSSPPARVVIAGGSGFLGTSLAAYFVSRGSRVVVLTRTPRGASPLWHEARWDARTVGEWAAHLEGADVLINLAGRSVNCVKTPDHCDEILRSRVESTRVLGLACRGVACPPPVWVQMSTAHIYGDPPDAVCDEGSALGVGLAPTVGRAWEKAFDAARLPDQRGVVLRTSFVIGRSNAGGAGALGTLARLARCGLGGRVGTGKQGFSWIHERDLNRVIDQAVRGGGFRGVYVASSPGTVSQEEFMRVLRRSAGGLGSFGVGLPAPALFVRAGAALVLRTDPELALYGRFVRPTRLIEAGFRFDFPSIDRALADLFSGAGGSERASTA